MIAPISKKLKFVFATDNTLTIQCEKKLNYLGMGLDFTEKFKVEINMIKNNKAMLKDIPEKMIDWSNTLAEI